MLYTTEISYLSTSIKWNSNTKGGFPHSFSHNIHDMVISVNSYTIANVDLQRLFLPIRTVITGFDPANHLNNLDYLSTQ